MAKKLNLCPFVIVAFFVYIAFAWQVSYQPLKYDEIWFLESAHTINRFGIPLYYWGEDTSYKYENNASSSLVSGLVHPPLYPYALTLFYNLFGSKTQTLRLFGMVFNLISVFLLYSIALSLWGKERGKRIWYIAAILYFINPAQIYHSLNLAVDTGLYPLFINLFIAVFVSQISEKKKITILSIILWLGLLSKYTTILFLPITMCIFFLMKKEWKKIFSFVLPITGVGLILWITTFSLYALLFNQSWLFVLKFTLLSRIIEAPLTLTHGLFNMVKSIAYNTLLLTPPFFLLLCMTSINRLAAIIKEKLSPFDYITLFSTLVLLAYSLKAPNFYYIYPLFISWSLIIAHYLEPYVQFSSRKQICCAMLYISLLITFFGFLFDDPLLLLPRVLPLNHNTGSLLLYLIMYVMLAVLPVVAFFFTKAKKNVQWLFFIAIVGVSLGVIVQHYFADYSTINIYGERGYEQTIGFMKERVNKSEVIIARWDIGYLIGTKFYSDDEFTTKNLCGIDNKQTRRHTSTCGILNVTYHLNQKEILSYDNVTYIVHSKFFRELDGGIEPELQKIIDSEYQKEAVFGDFTLFKKRQEKNS